MLLMSNFVSTFRTKTLFVCSRQLCTNDPINNLESIDVRSFDLSHFLLFVIEIKLTFVFISKSIVRNYARKSISQSIRTNGMATLTGNSVKSQCIIHKIVNGVKSISFKMCGEMSLWCVTRCTFILKLVCVPRVY